MANTALAESRPGRNASSFPQITASEARHAGHESRHCQIKRTGIFAPQLGQVRLIRQIMVQLLGKWEKPA